ncbi:MAG: hypothetical protein ABS76_07655 [Pelagibacterium sp. SCN 64-44]|nr:MAG: hypothetical protein ABS76_07655 [Pelagibacterium sp. SCN 64-44]
MEPRTRKPRKGGTSGTTLADVASHAGVSTATVSRMLNAPQMVSARMRGRIETAIRELHWVPNGSAQSLVTRRTKSIGAIIPTFGHQGIAGMAEALQGELSRARNTLLIGLSSGRPEETLRQGKTMLERGIDAIVLFGEDQPEELMELIYAQNLPHVIAYTSGTQTKSVCIGFDNFKEMAGLTRYLLELGHRSFGLIGREHSNNDRVRLRVAGLIDTLADEGIAIRPAHRMITENWSIGAGREAMRKILASPPVPTAVVCTNDYLAAGAAIEARAAGIKVPDEMSITGFDDLEWAAVNDPPLTSVRVPSEDIGVAIAKYLLDSLDGASPPRPEPLSAKLMVRGSTAPPQG